MRTRLIPLFFIFCLWAAHVQGQGTPAYSIATGTGSNAFPFNTTSVKRSQHLYLPGDIPSAISGNITRIYFRAASNTPGGGSYADLKIRLGQTSATMFPGSASLDFFTGLTTVLTAVNYVIPATVANDWIQIDLQNPYLYNATQTLIVEVEMSNMVSSSGPSVRTNNIPGSPNHKRLTATSLTATTGSASGLWSDFGIDVVPSTPCTAPPVAGTAVSNLANPCPGVGFTLSLTGSPLAGGITYQWQSSPNGTTWTNIAGATSMTYNTSQMSTTYYRAMVTCSGISAPSSSVQLVTSTTQVSGTYTINKNIPASATNFQSFTAAIDYFACGGINGPIVFNVARNSGPYNEQVYIPQVPGASATNTITFNGGGNTISATPSLTKTGVITLDGASYVRLDSLTLTLDNNATVGWGMQLKNGADYVTFSNSVINLPITTLSTDVNGIGSGSTISSPGSHTNHSTFINNTIIGGYYGIRLNGASGTAMATRNRIVNNTIKDFYSYGIYLLSSDSTLVENNDISRPTRTQITTFTGIFASGETRKLKIAKNRIHNSHDGTPTTTSSAYCIYFSGADASVGFENVVENNLIYNINTNGTIYGLYNSSSDGAHYFHNTVVLNHASNSGVVRGVYQTTLSGNIKIANNIFTIDGASGTKHALYFATAGSNIISNNNVFNVLNASVGYLSTTFVTLANWQGAASNAYDQNSLAADPLYVNPATANYQPSSLLVSNTGQPGTGVTDDIMGAPRSATTPDPGAYEFGVMPNDVGIVAISGPVSGCGLTATEAISVTIKNYGSSTQTSIPVMYKVNQLAPVTQTYTGSLAPNATTVLTFTQTANLSVSGPYTILAATQLTGDADASNDALTIQVANSLMPAGPVNINFELPATGLNALRVVSNTYSNVTESTAASTGAGTKGMIMDGVNNAAWVTPSGVTSPWTSNADFFSGVYMCFTPPAGKANDTLRLEFDLKQLYKTTHLNTNFRVTVNGQQVGATYNPPFGGYGTGTAPWTHVKLDISSYLSSPTIEIGLESSVKEEFASMSGTANLLDNIMVTRIAGPNTGTGIKENALQSEVAVFPNPSNGLFNVKVPATTRSYSVEVTDLTGKVVKQQVVKNNSGAEQLNLNGTAKGIYILKIASEGNVATRKLIVE